MDARGLKQDDLSALVSAFGTAIAFAYYRQIGVFLVIVHVSNPL